MRLGSMRGWGAFTFRSFIGVVMLLVGTPPASAWCGLDILGVCNDAKTLAPVIQALPDQLRVAAEAVTDRLFNVDLPPAIDKLTAARKALEDHGEHEYEVAVNATSKAVYALAQKALTLTEQLAANVTKDVEEVVAEVQHAIAHDIGKLFADIDDSVNKLLTRLGNDGKELFCAVENWATQFQNTLSAYFTGQDCECVQKMLKLNPGIKQDCECTSCFEIAGWYPKCSCKPLGLAFDSYHAKMKYDFTKCHLEKPIDWDTWTVDQILSQLGLIQAAALGFRCFEDMNPGSAILRDYFSNEYTSVSYTIDVWQNPGRSRQLQLRKQIRESMHVNHHSAAVDPLSTAKTSGGVRTLVATQMDSIVSTDGCTGKTIPECVTEAMAQLQEAQKSLDSARQDFDKAVAQESVGFQVFISECPSGWAEAEAAQGYMLAGRPKGAKAGAKFNRAFDVNEQGRVALPAHTHSVTDHGHTHVASVTDPGHGHSFNIGDHGGGAAVVIGPAGHIVNTGVSGLVGSSTSGVGVKNSQSQSSIQVNPVDADGEHYPFLYVVLCQKVQV